MNILLLEPTEVRDSLVRVEDRRAQHLLEVLKVKTGSSVRAGVLGGGTGQAEVVELGSASVTLRLQITDERAPTGDRVRLILALPRPKALRRLLRTVASMSLSCLELVNAWRVEKSYFQSPFLTPAALREQLVLGCEQGATTWLPQVRMHPLLLPFLESLPPPGAEHRLLAHPGAADGLESITPLAAAREVIAAIGPEGGWIDAELASFGTVGFRAVSLCRGVLRSEEALTALLSQLQLARRLPSISALDDRS